jgi:DNA-binding MarR family transcriptional regulator
MARAPSLIEFNRCNNTALRKASRRMSQVYDEFLAPTGLRSTQLSILAEIDRRPHEAPTIRELAAELIMDRSTVGQNLRPLERDNLITVGTNPSDGRSKRVALTSRGRAKVTEAHSLWCAAQTSFEKSFGAKAASLLRKNLLSIATQK